MCQYVISDNQYFSLGAAAVIKNNDVKILSPNDIINGKVKLERGICFIYIKNIMTHRVVCHLLRRSMCELIFFCDYGHSVEFNKNISPRFWSARIGLKRFRYRTTHINRFATDSVVNKISDLKLSHVFMASKGLALYIRWIYSRSGNTKIAHNKYRTLIQAVGIDRVSIHTLLLSEHMSVAFISIYYIRNNKIKGYSSDNSMNDKKISDGIIGGNCIRNRDEALLAPS